MYISLSDNEVESEMLMCVYGCICLCVWSTTQVITNLVKMVKARDIRRPFCPAGHWLSEEVNIRADKVLDCHQSGLDFVLNACE